MKKIVLILPILFATYTSFAVSKVIVFETEEAYLNNTGTEYNITRFTPTYTSINFKLEDGSRKSIKYKNIWGWKFNGTDCLNRVLKAKNKVRLYKTFVMGDYFMWIPYNYYGKEENGDLTYKIDIYKTKPSPYGFLFSKGVSGELRSINGSSFKDEFGIETPERIDLLRHFKKVNTDGFKKIYCN